MTVPAVPASGDDDLAAAGADMRAAIDQYLAVAVQRLERSPADAEANLRQPPRPHADDLPEHASWLDLMSEALDDEATARRLFGRMKTAARDDLASGRRAALTVEGGVGVARPIDRARFVELLHSVRDGLAPANGLEHRLCDQIAHALHMHEFWLQRHVMYEMLEAQRLDRDLAADGWQPPRLRDVEASDRAAAMADRSQRAALRCLKAYRDQRRILGVVIVADGGQLNVANQQVVTAAAPAGDE